MAISSIDLEAAEVAAAQQFYGSAFGLGALVGVRPESDEPASGFRGFTLSLVVSGPSAVDSLVGSALRAGATEVKAVTKTFWGYGGVVQAPDGALWKVATSRKSDKGDATGEVDEVVLLLGVADVKASKRFYTDQGLGVAKSFGSKYVEFDASSGIKLALYGRKALAKDAGVPAGGSGSHRIVVHGQAGSLVDPDGFTWEAQ